MTEIRESARKGDTNLLQGYGHFGDFKTRNEEFKGKRVTEELFFESFSEFLKKKDIEKDKIL